MSVFGIISEFNPFHNGHKYLFEQAKAAGAQAIVCIMSGNAVQRGEVALLDKHERARMALECGADLVLELPFPWCASSAEAFAAAGVRIASEYADTLIFGSECGDLDALADAARICADESFVEKYKAELKGNSGSAQTYFDILCAHTGRKYSSNDILGIEYIKAARRYKSDLSAITVKREGGAYSSEEIVEGDLQSASAIRALIAKGEIGSLGSHMPPSAAKVLLECYNDGETASLERLELALRLYFRTVDLESLEGIAELEGGLANRIKQVAQNSCDKSLLEELRTKRYTDARLRRAMLFALAGVKTEDIKSEPAYAELLGADRMGREILAKKRKSASVPVIAKPSDIPNTEAAKRQRELSLRLDSIFSLALQTPKSTASVVARSPIIIQE